MELKSVLYHNPKYGYLNFWYKGFNELRISYLESARKMLSNEGSHRINPKWSLLGSKSDPKRSKSDFFWDMSCYTSFESFQRVDSKYEISRPLK